LVRNAVLLGLLACFAALPDFGQAPAPHPSGVLTGRVVDDDGRPMRRAQVQALMRFRTGRGVEMLPRGNAAATNDRGEFRLFWLEPGTYFIVIKPPQLQPDPFRAPINRLGYIPADPEAAFVTTYFPGTPVADRAEAIQVASGELDVHAIPMASLKTRVIRGRILESNMPQNKAAFVSVAIYPLTDSAYAPLEEENVFSPAGQFELRAGIEPGQYRIAARLSTPDAAYAGSSVFEIGQTDPEPVDIALSQALSIKGDIRVETGTASSLPGSLFVSIYPNEPNTGGMRAAADVRSSGKFVLENILPQSYRLEVFGLPADMDVGAVRLQDRDADPEALVLPDGLKSVNLTVIINKK
jgi:hypothetical protein